MGAVDVMDFTCGEAENIRGGGAIPCCNNDIKMRVTAAKVGSSCCCFGDGCDWEAGQSVEFAPVWGNPGSQREELMKGLEAV